MAKNKVRREIKEATIILKEIMIDNLGIIAESMIDQIMANLKKLTPATRLNAIKDLSNYGVSSYKKILLESMAVTMTLAIENARKEVPKASKVELKDWDHGAIRLGEYEKLPSKIKKKLQTQVDLLTKTQKADLDKVIAFQFTSSYDSTDSENTIEYDLFDTADSFIHGPSINAGSSMMAAKGINDARQAFFFDDEVLEEIDAFQFVNDVPETPICEDLNGTIFSAKDPNFQRYTPPLHFNCDSYIIPILKGSLGDGDEITQLKPSSADLEKYIQFHDKDNCHSCRVSLVQL